MKKSSLLINIALAVLMISALSSCKKDSFEILSGSVWSFSDFTTTSDNSDIQSLMAFGKAALTDGTLSFFDDGTYELTSPVLEANSGTETGTWELEGNSLIIFTTGGLPRNATIDKIEKDKLVFLETYLYLDTTSYTVKYTWVK